MSLRTIKLYPDTKERIDRYKHRGTSYDDVIAQFLDYFESTGIKPNEIDSSPMTVTKKATERVVKILRNIETKKIHKMISMLDDILLRLSKPDAKGAMPEAIISSKEVEQLVSQIENLESDNTKLENEIEKLLSRAPNPKMVERPKPDLDFLKTIKAAVQELRDNVKNVQFQKDEYKIKKNILDRNLDTITNLIKNR